MKRIRDCFNRRRQPAEQPDGHPPAPQLAHDHHAHPRGPRELGHDRGCTRGRVSARHSVAPPAPERLGLQSKQRQRPGDGLEHAVLRGDVPARFVVVSGGGELREEPSRGRDGLDGLRSIRAALKRVDDRGDGVDGPDRVSRVGAHRRRRRRHQPAKHPRGACGHPRRVRRAHQREERGDRGGVRRDRGGAARVSGDSLERRAGFSRRGDDSVAGLVR